GDEGPQMFRAPARGGCVSHAREVGYEPEPEGDAAVAELLDMTGPEGVRAVTGENRLQREGRLVEREATEVEQSQPALSLAEVDDRRDAQLAVDEDVTRGVVPVAE